MAMPPAILGLSLGTRKVGTALITSNHLDCARVWVFPGRWSDKKLQKMIAKLERKVYKYRITAIAIKIPTLTHHTAGLKQLIAAIKEYCKINSIFLHVCTIKELKAYNFKEGNKNKKMLIEALAKKYPQLFIKARKELANRNAHHIKMFEAVAAAELLQTMLSKAV